MSRNLYTLLGYVVWRAGKWYLRRRLPSRRRLAVSMLGAGAGAVAIALAVVVARRAIS
jgi:hypothetical protein